MELKIHPHAAADIRTLRDNDVNGIGKLLALLSAIKADPELVDRLNLQGEVIEFESGSNVNVLRVQSVKRIADIWRLKGFESKNKSIPYRFLYAFLPATQYRRIPQIHILAAVDRSKYNYEPDHEITIRVLADYRELF